MSHNGNDRIDVWVGSDAHVGTDLKFGRTSLADPLRQSEGACEGYPGFSWDIMLDLGDLSGEQGQPTDEEGRDVVRQYGVLTEHERERVYNLAGNHDASGSGDSAQWWFRKYVDPVGENPETSGVDARRRPYPIEGTWERYRFRVGNILFLVMSDRNDGAPPVGRGERGGYPAGAVTGETFDWWVEQVESNQDSIIITAHHHMLKATTVGSGEWEGFRAVDRYGRRKPHYHGYFADGGPMGAGYLYWVDGNPDAQAFERYLAANPGAIDIWLGGHTHAPVGSTKNGRSHLVRKWDVTFMNCAALTRYHGFNVMGAFPAASRLLSFSEGSRGALVRCYLHTADLAPGGWYPPEERRILLRHPFGL